MFGYDEILDGLRMLKKDPNWNTSLERAFAFGFDCADGNERWEELYASANNVLHFKHFIISRSVKALLVYVAEKGFDTRWFTGVEENWS